jgi:hypothetical protein
MRNKGRTRKSTSEIAQQSDPSRRRGRPTDLRYSEIYGRAQNLQFILNQVWNRLWPLLSQAVNEQEVVEAFENGSSPYQREFLPYAAVALETKRERTFPRRARSQQRFLADSLAALGQASPRRSRDICMKERTKAKRAHRIIRYEYYVECSCGYEGPAKDRACRKCGATIPPSLFG